MTDADQWAAHSRLPALVDALALAPDDEPVRRVVGLFGIEPASVVEYELGEPAIQVRKLRFASGGEIVLHDDTVVGVILHVKPDADSVGVVNLEEWIDGVTADATLDELEGALGLKSEFPGADSFSFTIGAGYAIARFAREDGKGGWKDPGNLARIVVMAERPAMAIAPDDDECPVCGSLLVRGERGFLVDETITRLQAAVAANDLKEDAAWVALEDLQALHASGLMRHVESQLSCRRCWHVICLALHRDGPPTFGIFVANDARMHPMEPIPPVEQWGSAERQAVAQQAMQYFDHEPGSWFLVQQGDRLYLDARYSYSAVIDSSALIELDPSEREAYRKGGHTYLGELAYRIHMSAPYQADSPYYARDLYRRGGEPGRDYRSEVSAAIVNHTWLAEQRAKRV